jgi:PhnB protein
MLRYPLPEGHHTITPGMVVAGAGKLITFLERAYGGQVVERYESPDGHVTHAEVKIGDSVVMMGDPLDGFPPMPCMLSLYVDDVDGTYQRALAAGAESLTTPENTFYGHRSARVRDPVGNVWAISAIVEQLSKAQIAERMAKL